MAPSEPGAWRGDADRNPEPNNRIKDPAWPVHSAGPAGFGCDERLREPAVQRGEHEGAATSGHALHEDGQVCAVQPEIHRKRLRLHRVLSSWRSPIRCCLSVCTTEASCKTRPTDRRKTSSTSYWPLAVMIVSAATGRTAATGRHRAPHADDGCRRSCRGHGRARRTAKPRVALAV